MLCSANNPHTALFPKLKVQKKASIFSFRVSSAKKTSVFVRKKSSSFVLLKFKLAIAIRSAAGKISIKNSRTSVSLQRTAKYTKVKLLAFSEKTVLAKQHSSRCLQASSNLIVAKYQP